MDPTELLELLEVKMADDDGRQEEVVCRPPLRGVSMPILTPTPGTSISSLEDKLNREKELSRQISELIRVRDRIRLDHVHTRVDDNWKQEEGAPEQRWENSEATWKRNGPKIAANVQLVPPGNEEYPPLLSTLRGQKVRVRASERVQDHIKEATRMTVGEWTMVEKKRAPKGRALNEQTVKEGVNHGADLQLECKKSGGKDERGSQTTIPLRTPTT